MLSSVADQEEKIDALRNDNEIWREKLHELQISQSETNAQTNRSQSTYAPELNTLDKKLVIARKECEAV